MDKLYIIVPAYNEAENIEKLIDDWYPVIERHNGNGESRLVVINDGSKDETYTILKNCAETRPLLKPLTKENGGHGSTLNYSIKRARGKYFRMLDGDDWYDTAQFEQFIETCEI